MLSAQVSGRVTPFRGATLGSVDPGVKMLQDELSKLSSQTGNVDVLPDNADGTMSLGTIVALSHAAGVLGSSVDSRLGKAIDVVDLIKRPLNVIPYADQVLDIVLSPWIIDNVFDTILAIVSIIPGAGDAAASIREGVKAFEQILVGAASSIAGALALARKALPNYTGLTGAGAWSSALTRQRAQYYNTSFHGALLGDVETLISAQSMTTLSRKFDPPASVSRPPIIIGGPGTCAAGTYRNAAGKCVAIPSCPSGQTFNVATQACAVLEVHSHIVVPWPKGQPIIPSDWSRSKQFKGPCTLNDLATADANAFTAMVAKVQTQSAPQDVKDRVERAVRAGVVAFRKFQGADGAWMGAFFDVGRSTLTIVPLPAALVPPPHPSEWDQFTDAVGNAVNYAADALADAARATGSLLADLWNAIDDQVIMVYEIVKKYGCALVSSDIVVAAVATGAGIVATPATSAGIVAGAVAGRAACAAIEVGELVYKILKLLSTDFPAPPPPPGQGAAASTGLTISPNPIYMATSRIPAGRIVIPPPSSKYKPGSISRYNITRRVWTIYSPLAGLLGCSSCRGGLLGAPLGDVDVIPAPPAGFVKAGEEAAPPGGVTKVGSEEDVVPFWRRPFFWGGVLGIFAVGGAGIYVVRRRRQIA